MKAITLIFTKYPWLIILNLYLISPLIISLNLSTLPDPVILWNISCSVVALIGFQLLFKRPYLFHLLIFPFYITVAMDLFTLLAFNSRLSSGYIWIILANMSSWNDFFQTFYIPIILTCLFFLPTYIFLIWKIKKLSFSLSKKWGGLFLLILILLYVLLAARQMKVNGVSIKGAAIDVIEHDFSSPFGIISQFYVTFSSIQKDSDSILQRSSFNFNATQTPLTPRDEIYIMVLGETSRYDHWEINGYARNTSPNLEKSKNLISFSNVIAEWTLTQKSVPIMLSQASVMNFDKALKEKSIISAYKDAKFQTFWLTTQAFDHFAGNIHVIANEANIVRYYTRQYDQILLDEVQNIISQSTSNTSEDKIFIVLHTKGSHFEFSKRYPKNFGVFKDSSEQSWKENLINRYDNSILYTDLFLSNLIKMVKNKNAISAILYASDHGENLMDTEENLLGHNFANQYDSPIPMFFWYSDKYKNQYPQKVLSVKQNKSKKIGTINIFHSLADMANIKFTSMEIDKSIFHLPLIEQPRIIYKQNEDKYIDYDKYYKN